MSLLETASVAGVSMRLVVGNVAATVVPSGAVDALVVDVVPGSGGVVARVVPASGFAAVGAGSPDGVGVPSNTTSSDVEQDVTNRTPAVRTAIIAHLAVPVAVNRRLIARL